MPWKELNVMELRTQFIAEWLAKRYTVTALSQRYGISRQTAHKWIGRFKRDGFKGLTDRSTAPHHRPQRTPAMIREQIIASKLLHQHWGPKKVVDYLKRHQPKLQWPADSTVGEILKQAGLVKARNKRKRVGADVAVFKDCDRCNRVWSVDYKGQFVLGNGRLCYPLTVTDNYSRYLLQCRALASPNHRDTRSWLEWVFREYGLPQAIRSDNGAPFASMAAGGISRLSRWWIQLGIKPERIKPGKPQHNGRHERMHRTLKAEATRPAAYSLEAQQKRFDAFCREYNDERSHESLERKCPVQVYQPSPQTYPERVPEVEYEQQVQVRSVRHNGQIKWKGEFIYVTEILAKDRVGLTEIDNDLWEVRYGFYLLGFIPERTMKLERAKAWHGHL